MKDNIGRKVELLNHYICIGSEIKTISNSSGPLLDSLFDGKNGHHNNKYKIDEALWGGGWKEREREMIKSVVITPSITPSSLAVMPVVLTCVLLLWVEINHTVYLICC